MTENLQMIKIRKIKADGTEVELTVHESEITLKFMQEHVGGYIQIISLNERQSLVLNEEGKILDLKPNSRATFMMRERYRTTDYIVGDVLVMPNKYL